MEFGASYFLTMGLIIFLIWCLSLWQVFTKGGYAGWKCLIPVYNIYILSKIGSQPTWVFILSLVPVIGFIGSILISIAVAESFGRGVLFGIFGLFIFSFFGYMYIGWGQAEYNKLETE